MQNTTYAPVHRLSEHDLDARVAEVAAHFVAGDITRSEALREIAVIAESSKVPGQLAHSRLSGQLSDDVEFKIRELFTKCLLDDDSPCDPARFALVPEDSDAKAHSFSSFQRSYCSPMVVSIPARMRRIPVPGNGEREDGSDDLFRHLAAPEPEQFDVMAATDVDLTALTSSHERAAYLQREHRRAITDGTALETAFGIRLPRVTDPAIAAKVRELIAEGYRPLRSAASTLLAYHEHEPRPKVTADPDLEDLLADLNPESLTTILSKPHIGQALVLAAVTPRPAPATASIELVTTKISAMSGARGWHRLAAALVRAAVETQTDVPNEFNMRITAQQRVRKSVAQATMDEAAWRTVVAQAAVFTGHPLGTDIAAMLATITEMITEAERVAADVRWAKKVAHDAAVAKRDAAKSLATVTTIAPPPVEIPDMATAA